MSRSAIQAVIRPKLHSFLLLFFMLSASSHVHADLWNEVEHGFVDSGGVKIHYATTGTGPLVLMVHGFPDFWYTWHHQMDALKDNFKVVAIDQRGYNLSDKPAGDENYDMRLLIADLAAVIQHFGEEQATVVGHDWGGMVSWQFALHYPQMVDKLIILNLPHPNGMAREMAINPEQRANSDYGRRFREGSPSDPDIFFGAPMSPEIMSMWVTDPAVRPRYVEAFRNSDFNAMLAYYKRNYPALPPEGSAPPSPDLTPRLPMPVLVFHGLKDTALHSDGLNNTWDWVDADTTIVSAPEAGHFVQQDAAELVSSTMKWWLLARP